MFKRKKSIIGTWSSEKNRVESDNYNLVMDRTWYFIASTYPFIWSINLFWEYNAWVEGCQGQRFTNHTVIRNINAPEVKDFGIWNGFINKEGFYTLQPVIKMLGLRIPSPIKLATRWLTFPKNDSFDEMWTYYGDMMNKRFLFMFALTPHVSEEAYQTALNRLEDKNRLDLRVDLIHRLRWPESYKPGDSGEDKINKESENDGTNTSDSNR